MQVPSLGLNRIIHPRLTFQEFAVLATLCGCSHIELRNDLDGVGLYDNLTTVEALHILTENRLSLESINALQNFNDRTEMLQLRREELRDLLEAARALNCRSIVLCPVNGLGVSEDLQQWDDQTRFALTSYGPLFEEYGMLGYVECLGFPQSSLRSKAKAVRAIEESGYSHCYKLVHDTFHHALAGEAELFPEQTGLVHVSGVLPNTHQKPLSDSDRVLVTPLDVLESKKQVQALLDGGYKGVISFEPFNSTIQQLDQEVLVEQVKESIAYLFSDDAGTA